MASENMHNDSSGQPPASTRTLDARETHTLVDWAAAEGWNPGLDDAEVFHRIDPEGYIGGFVNDALVAGVSVVDVGDGLVFLGLYLCQPAFRGQGIGYATWQAGIAHAGDRCIGLDGVPAQQANYRRSGFEFAWNNARFGGIVRADGPGTVADAVTLAASPVPATARDLPDMLALDAAIGGVRRQRYVTHWCRNDAHRTTLIVRDTPGGGDSAGALLGFATRRRCLEGYKIGPVLAEDAATAASLVAALTTDIGENPVFLDVPACNRAAVSLAESLGLAPVFETARMYRGSAPLTDTDRLFGVTSFELG